ncbi:hypothetical protein RRF57_000683 [Xylaria bambusicola]|uniref:Uncharacterized protein n=1 Tax=Xylaria bambusicola TaxID=326684 RepID=A0AAN7Z0X3_9PEZI
MQPFGKWHDSNTADARSHGGDERFPRHLVGIGHVKQRQLLSSHIRLICGDIQSQLHEDLGSTVNGYPVYLVQ